jgi:uncharacterized membrane protein
LPLKAPPRPAQNPSPSFFGVKEGNFMVEQPKKDTPFGLEPNVAAGLAYLFTWVGGIVMLVGGGTNKFVRFSAAQSIVLWVAWWVVYVAFFWFVVPILHLWLLIFPLWSIWGILALVLWLWTFISAFQGKEVRIPVVDNLTESIFKSML